MKDMMYGRIAKPVHLCTKLEARVARHQVQRWRCSRPKVTAYRHVRCRKSVVGSRQDIAVWGSV